MEEILLLVARLKYTQTSETLEDDNNNEPRKNINLDYISFRLGSDRLQNYFSTKRYNRLLIIANCDFLKVYERKELENSLSKTSIDSIETEYSEVTLNNDLNPAVNPGKFHFMPSRMSLFSLKIRLSRNLVRYLNLKSLLVRKRNLARNK